MQLIDTSEQDETWKSLDDLILSPNALLVAARSLEDEHDAETEKARIYKYDIIRNQRELFIKYPNGFFPENTTFAATERRGWSKWSNVAMVRSV